MGKSIISKASGPAWQIRPAALQVAWLVACTFGAYGSAGVYSRAVVGQEKKPAAYDESALYERFDGERAYRILRQICELGPRPSGSEAMMQQVEMLEGYFKELGLQTERQSFEFPHWKFEEPVELTNLIVRFQPEARDRILFCCHYDTRPYPENDPENPRGTFVGANDGASGVALLAELARHLSGWQTDLGVDLVFFDAEEMIYDRRRDQLFIGSTYFARRYASQPRDYFYRFGVLVDMVGDAQLELYYERNSLRMARVVTRQIWQSAKVLRAEGFVARPRHEISDDHLPLNEIARVPTTNLVDFDYPKIGTKQSYWHTEKDTPDKCSAASLKQVGRVLLHWLQTQR